MAHHDRLQSIGRLAAGVAHEIGNPLAGILMVARNLQAESEPEDVPERLELVVSEASRIQAIVESLVVFSRSDGTLSPTTKLSPITLQPIVHGAVRLVQLTHKDVHCVADCPPDLCVVGDPQQLTQVFVNLLSNACDASQAGAEVRLAASNGGSRVIVEVADEGAGMDEETKRHIFEPFFTTKDPGAGTGLGLSIVHRIVEQHSGSIEVQSKPGLGTRFNVTLVAARRTP